MQTNSGGTSSTHKGLWVIAPSAALLLQQPPPLAPPGRGGDGLLLLVVVVAADLAVCHHCARAAPPAHPASLAGLVAACWWLAACWGWLPLSSMLCCRLLALGGKEKGVRA